MQSELVTAWRRSVERLRQAEQFIENSRPIETSDPEQAYASRVLILYASCQYAMQQLGTASLRRLAAAHQSVDRLPKELQIAHVVRAMKSVSTDAKEWDWQVAKSALTGLGGNDWAAYSAFDRIEGNVWPDRIVEYCNRFTVQGVDFDWRQNAVNSNGVTYDSRFRSLVQERNPLAHGHLEPNVLSTELMLEWAGDCRKFLNLVYLAVAKAIFLELPKRTKRIGKRDRAVAFGPNTVPMLQLDSSVREGDFVLLRARNSDSVRGASILSLMSNEKQLSRAAAGSANVALGLSASVETCELYAPP